MKSYFIEGVYLTRQGLKKKTRSGKIPQTYVEPFGRAIWADSAEGALRLATRELDGGLWLEGPYLSESEEQRMRDLGAPQLPGFDLR